jgi:hypothetical protein
VRQLGPLAFDYGSHFIRDVVDAFDLQHVLVEALQVCGHHDLAADDVRIVGAALLAITTNHKPDTRIPPERVWGKGGVSGTLIVSTVRSAKITE